MSEFCTAKEMARRLGVPVSSFAKYVREGLLPPGFKLGKHRLWRADVVFAALEGGVQSGYGGGHDNLKITPKRASAGASKRKDPVHLSGGPGYEKRRAEGTAARRSPYTGVLGGPE